MNEKFNLIKEWFQKAEHDIAVVELSMKNDATFTDVICFHCQQAAEKYLKGCLIFLDISFKKTHDLSYLLELLNKQIQVDNIFFSYAEILNSFSVEIRYPDDWFEPTQEDVKEAYDISIKFKILIEEIIKKMEE
ncbi:MAG: HEPN domain-containing protein [Candidatus Cloacimonadota bacterium]|nr:HEPN domain-containing protein [Candidatus Cloacimonadota bacterium]